MQFPSTFSLLLMLLCSCIILQACENDMKEVQALNKKKVQVEEGKNISSYMSQSGVVKAHLTAPLMLNYRTDSPYVEFPKGIHVDFFKDSLIIESVTTAKYSKYLQSEQRVLLRDSVLIYNKITGDTLRTSLLWWDQAKGIFYTDRPVDVHVKAYTEVLHGDHGMIAPQNFSKFTLFKTTGTMLVPADMHP